jgi:hypothetical protein
MLMRKRTRTGKGMVLKILTKKANAYWNESTKMVKASGGTGSKDCLIAFPGAKTMIINPTKVPARAISSNRTTLHFFPLLMKIIEKKIARMIIVICRAVLVSELPAPTNASIKIPNETMKFRDKSSYRLARKNMETSRTSKIKGRV